MPIMMINHRSMVPVCQTKENIIDEKVDQKWIMKRKQEKRYQVLQGLINFLMVRMREMGDDDGDDDAGGDEKEEVEKAKETKENIIDEYNKNKEKYEAIKLKDVGVLS